MNEARPAALSCDVVATVRLDDGSGDAIIYRRRQMRSRRTPLAVRTDLSRALMLAGGVAVARTTAPATWDRCCRLLAGRRRPQPAAPGRAGLRVLTGRDDLQAAQHLVQSHRRGRIRKQWMFAAEIAGRMRAARVEFRPEDVERLRAALARGRGAAVWVDDTYAGPLIAKRALAEAGFALHHVSTVDHGVSGTRLAMALLNPYHLRAENRYLAERLVFRPEGAAEVTRRVLKVVKAGGLVTITNSTGAGSGFIELPAGDGGFLRLATTAPNLAIRHGVALFSMAAIEVVPFEHYRIELGSEVGAQAAVAARSGHDALAAAARVVRDEMLPRLRRWPGQYLVLRTGGLAETHFPQLRASATPGPAAAR